MSYTWQDLHDAVDWLREDGPMHVDDPTADRAQHILTRLERARLPLPQLFSHGDDAVVFTWHECKPTRYITVCAIESFK